MSKYSDNNNSSPKQPPEEVRLMEVYNIYQHRTTWAEQDRWTRLNNLLIASSIFTLAWATIYASSGTHLSLARRLVLTAICVPGILCGYWWSGLGARTSEYLNMFYGQTLKMEEELREKLQLPDALKDLKMPFTLINPIRERVKTNPREKHMSSTWLATNVPFMFMVLFVVLVCVSWKEIFIDILMYLLERCAGPL
jgi:hypothetical protein